MRTLAEILRELGETAPHVVIAGDGSGSGWKTSAGWACISVNCFTGVRTAHYGGLSMGSINLAELLPYLHALICFHETGGGRDILASRGHCRVVIITDSGYVVQSGNIAADPRQVLPGTHGALWAAVRHFVQLGYLITFHHKSRSTTALNQWSDLVASLARKSVVAAVTQNLDAVQTETVERLDIRHLNP